LRLRFLSGAFGNREPPAETNDLIYEGIATNPAGILKNKTKRAGETNDLIYEGIATS